MAPARSAWPGRGRETALCCAGDDGNPVGLDLHAAAAAKPLLSAPELAIDSILDDWYAGRESRQGRDKTLAVGLPRRFKSKHLVELLC